MKIGLTFLMIVISTNMTMAQTVTEMPLYAGAIPGAKSSNVKEQIIFTNGAVRISNVVLPTLTRYAPVNPNGLAVIICPGGGYGRLAIDHEGVEIAKRLNESGIAAFVLKYRLPGDSIMIDKTIGPLQDAQQAIRTVRKNATTWNIDPGKIGIMGFSAGGHLASTAATHINMIADKTIKDITSVRPDFAILVYPVISFDAAITHRGSKDNLVGKDASAKLVNEFSNELQVTKETPPTFLVHAGDDGAVPVENSLRYYQACIKNKVPVEMHLYPGGGHGFGLHNKTTKEEWFDLLLTWLKELPASK